MVYQGTPLTPLPEDLTVWKTATPWQTVRSMLGLVLVCFFIAQISVLIVAGFIDGDINGTFGPFEPILTFVGGICLSPLLMLFFYLRRPRLTHSITAEPHPNGVQQHILAGGSVVLSPVPTVVRHHLFRSTAPLEMPRPLHLWALFFGGVIISSVCLLPLMILGPTTLSVLLALLIVLPAWLIGFAAPVFAWWSISSRHLGINISRRNAEWILAAGMLSTIPAIIINSLISPLILDTFGLNAMEPGSWGEGFVLFLSAPIGEELSKALAVLALSHLIISPKHGFYVGSTVGLGFALLENAQYISLALVGDYSSISYFFTAMIRGLSSIPGHALWTGLSGYAIGCWIARGNRLPSLSERSSYVTHNAKARWVLYNKNGTPESTTGWANIPSDRMMKFVARWEQQAWNLPRTIPAGIGAAMLGHGLWNGTSWGVSRLLSDVDPAISLVLQLAWMMLMIATLWLFILRWLPSIVLDASDQRF